MFIHLLLIYTIKMSVSVRLQSFKNLREPVGTASTITAYSLGVTGFLNLLKPVSDKTDLFLYKRSVLFQIKYLWGLTLCLSANVQARSAFLWKSASLVGILLTVFAAFASALRLRVMSPLLRGRGGNHLNRIKEERHGVAVIINQSTSLLLR